MKQMNSSVGKYFALVVLFFTPLMSNLLHYVIMEHEFGKRNHQLEWIDGGKVHYCDQYLFKIYPAIEVPSFCIEIVPLVVYNNTVLTTSEIVDQRVALFYFNRGPPLI